MKKVLAKSTERRCNDPGGCVRPLAAGSIPNTARIFYRDSFVVLSEKLKNRDMFAHVSGIIPIVSEADGLIEDLIKNVLPRIT
jgi:hypothetical protein